MEVLNKIRKYGFVRSLKLIRRIFKHKFKFIRGFYVNKRAILEDRCLIKINKNVEINEYVIIRTFENIVEIGENSQINPFTVIYGGSGVTIGKNVMIAPNCVIAAGNHNYKQLEKPMRFANDISKGPIIIEDGVWVGANSTITSGVTLGNNSVVAANSVVTKNIKPFDIVSGNPARTIFNRIENYSGVSFSTSEFYSEVEKLNILYNK